MADKLIIANWKMNGSLAGLADYVQNVANVPVVICPPAALIQPVAEAIKGTSCVLGAQDCHAEGAGAHTGDTSAVLLAELGVRYVIVGHSERRRGHSESDAFIWRKATRVSDLGMVPILCVGEKEGENRDEALKQQLQGLTSFLGREIVIAYEPVWAISAAGTGRMPTPSDIKDAHLSIKVILEKTCPNARARVIYGGSVKAENALYILGEKSVDGVLVGAASLDPQQIIAIYKASVQANAGL